MKRNAAVNSLRWRWHDFRDVTLDRLWGRVLCLLGRHRVRFGTAPRCYRCDKIQGF